MSASLGLDHPLIAVRNMARARDTYASLGFTLSPEGMHPWGTSTSLVLFERQILEIISIGDAQLLDAYPAGNFSFGRHVEKYLNEREGVALSALFTENSEAVEKALLDRGIGCVGTMNFGRDVIRADGQADRTKTTLKIFPNPSHPRLSVFACHQHRRDLLEFPHLMKHPNSADGIAAVTVCCPEKDQDSVLAWLSGLHGNEPARSHGDEFTVQTSNGFWRVCSPTSLERLFGTYVLPPSRLRNAEIVGVDIRVRSLEHVEPFLPAGTVQRIGNAMVLSDAVPLGGIMLRFVPA